MLLCCWTVWKDGCCQIRWRSADSGAETSRDPGESLRISSRDSKVSDHYSLESLEMLHVRCRVSLGAVGLQSGSRSSTETLPGGELHPLPHLGEGTPMRFTSEPNRHELQASWQFLAILGMLQCFAISERSCVSARQWVVLHCCWRLHFKAIISFQCTCMRIYTYNIYDTYRT